jgi:PPOX class probable FMN-dependent enzyme
MSAIATIEQLEAIYGFPNDASTVKVADRVTPRYRTLIEKSPFAALATCGPEGLDCSPRGDLPGFVRIHDEKTLMMPDRRGNNRCDSLRNIVRDPRAALLFLIPGSGSTLRVNGRAQVSADPGLLDTFKMDGKAPRTVVVMTVFPMRARHRPSRSLESRQAGRSPDPADTRPDPGRHERQHGGRRKIRSGMAGARAANDVVRGYPAARILMTGQAGQGIFARTGTRLA